MLETGGCINSAISSYDNAPGGTGVNRRLFLKGVLFRSHEGGYWSLLRRLCGYQLVFILIWIRKIKAQGLKRQ